MQVVINISEDYYKAITEIPNHQCTADMLIIKNGTPLPKGHGRIVDIGKIDKDKIESDNPIISLMIDDKYIEAVSLDYLNNLPTIIEADKEGN